MSKTQLAAIAMLAVGLSSAFAQAQENRLLKHFDAVVTDGEDQREFYGRLVKAEGDLAAAAAIAKRDMAAMREELSEALAVLLDDQDAMRRNQFGKALPNDINNNIDSVVLLMLVTTMPDLQWRTMTVNRRGRDIDFMPQLSYLVRNTFGDNSQELRAPGPIRDIATEWIRTVGLSLQGQQAVMWGLQNEFRDPCLAIARRILSQGDDSSLWLRPQDGKVNPGIRLSMQRTAIAVVEKWGSEADAWALLKLVYRDQPEDPTDVNARYRLLAGNQALGVLIRMQGLHPTDYQMRENLGSYNSYSFRNPEEQAIARARFKAWWEFLPPWKSAKGTDVAQIDLQSAINLIFKSEYVDLDTKRSAVARIDQEPEDARVLLSKVELENEDKQFLKSVILDRMASKLADQLIASQPTAATVAEAREQFVRLLGTPDGQAPFFDEMVESEPGLISALSAYLAAPASDKEFYGEVLARVFMRRESAVAQRFQRHLNEYLQARVAAGKPGRAAGAVYPDNLDDPFFASVASLLFVRGERPLEIPTPLLGLLSRILNSGLETGANQQKSPVLEFIQSQGDRGEALGQCIKSACLAADEVSQYNIAISIALRYRFEDTALQLAHRVCDPSVEFPNTFVRGNLLQLAIHCFMSFGKAEKDLQVVASLLEDEQRVRLGGFPADQKRRHIEIREFALIAAQKMVGRNPDVMKGDKVTGYCPMKQQVKLEIIADPERWKEIQQTVDDWLVEFAGGQDGK